MHNFRGYLTEISAKLNPQHNQRVGSTQTDTIRLLHRRICYIEVDRNGPKDIGGYQNHSIFRNFVVSRFRASELTFAMDTSPWKVGTSVVIIYAGLVHISMANEIQLMHRLEPPDNYYYAFLLSTLIQSLGNPEN